MSHHGRRKPGGNVAIVESGCSEGTIVFFSLTETRAVGCWRQGAGGGGGIWLSLVWCILIL